jgi:diguanylate cyclase (GGDEF)-like protein/PAS domain S-box-containing protein
MAGFLVRIGGIMDYSEVKKVQLIEEIEALQQKIAELERAETERKQAEEALRESEEKYRNVVERANDGVAIIQDTILKYINPRLGEMWGSTVEEIIGTPFTDHIHPDELPTVADHYKRRMAGEDVPPIYEIVLMRKDGSKLYAEVNAGIITHQGKLADLIIVRDITERKQAEEALRESEERLREAQEMGRIGDWEFDIDNQTIRWSDQTYELYERDPALGLPTPEEEATYYSPEQAKLLREYARRAIEEGEEFEYDLQAKLPSGRTAHFTATMRPIKDENGRVSKLFGTVQDITERKQAEHGTQERRMYLEGVLGAVPDAIVTLDAHHQIVEWNAGAERLFGYSQEEARGQNLDHLVTNPDTFEEAVGFTQIVMSRRDLPPVETVRYRKDGSPVNVIAAGSPILVEDELIGVVAVYTDITGRKEAEQQLAHVATHDALTGLPNRMLFNDRLTLELAHAHRSHQKLALMLLDLDHFKDANDTLGHSVGDQLLRLVGERLTSVLRKSDTVARMGGDEFMLILPEVAGVKDAANTAKKILEAVREPFVLDDYELNITTSIGIALYPYDGEDTDTLMRNADIAMYRAKRQGRDNCQRYTSPMNAEALE